MRPGTEAGELREGGRGQISKSLTGRMRGQDARALKPGPRKPWPLRRVCATSPAPAGSALRAAAPLSVWPALPIRGFPASPSFGLACGSLSNPDSTLPLAQLPNRELAKWPNSRFPGEKFDWSALVRCTVPGPMGCVSGVSETQAQEGLSSCAFQTGGHNLSVTTEINFKSCHGHFVAVQRVWKY